MSRYFGDLRRGQTIRLPFNTVNGSNAPTTLSSGAVQVLKDGNVVTPSGGVTLTVDLGSVTGSHVVIIDTSVDTSVFTAGSNYSVRISGSSNVAGTSVVGIYVGAFSIENRAVAVDSSGRITLAPSQVAVKKNTSLTHTIYMRLTNGNAATGVTVTAQRSIDGGAWANCTTVNPTELTVGGYAHTLSASDLNGNAVTVKYTASGCQDLLFYFYPQA